MEIKSFFLANTSYSQDDIVSISDPIKGWNNSVYFVKTKDSEYTIREVNGGLHGKETNVDHHDEIISLKLLEIPFVYLDETTGDFIKLKFEGNTYQTEKTPQNILNNVINEEVCYNIGAKLRKIHLTNISGHIKDFIGKQFNIEYKKQNIEKLGQEKYDLFTELIKKYDDSNKVLSHNDLFLPNIVINEENGVEIIDFEHCRPSNEFWDITFFLDDISALYIGQKDNLRKAFFDGYGLKKEEELDEVTKHELAFMNHVNEYLWISEMDSGIETLEWEKKNKNIVEQTYSWLISQ